MKEPIITIENVKKKYRLGAIGGGTLTGDIESWWARKRGKEDPNSILGKDTQEKKDIFWALRGVNFNIYQGDAIGIIGMNGAGKSTLLKILSRTTAPTEGKIEICGRVTSMLEVGTGFHGELTGRENIYLNGAILGMNKQEVDFKIDDIIEFSECGEFIDTPVKRYSSGMYVKLAFAVASHLDSEIMIMDEVLAVGDVKYQNKCIQKMKDIVYKDKRTILYVSHNLSTVQRLCNRCVVLNKGKLIYDGNVEDAIKVYLSNTIEEDTFVDLEKAARFPNNTQNITMLSLEMISKENVSILMKEKVKFRLLYRINRDTNELCMKMIFRYSDTTPAGLCLLNHVKGGKAGEVKELVFDLEPKTFAPGTYDYRLVLMELAENGGEVGHDTLQFFGKLNIVQGVDDIDNLNWVHDTYGHAFYGNLNCINNDIYNKEDAANDKK